MSTRNIADIYPLSPLQQGMLFHSLYAPETGVYFEQSSWLLEGHLDELALRKAWQKVIDRHPALRTSFLWEEMDEPLQVVHRQVELPVERQDWCALDAVQQAARLDAFLKEDRQRGFDLSEAPLMRLALFQIAEDRFHFVWSHHHLLFDGWSQPIILKEFLTFYEAFREGRQIVLPEPCSYRDYIAWLQRQNLSEAEAFWRRSLDGFQSRTLTGLDAGLALQEAGDEEGSYSHQTDLLPGRTLAALQTLAQQHRLTLNTFVQGAWALLLSRYSGEEDVVFGATVSGRPVDLPGAEGIVGMFINTLPVRVRVPREMAALDWLKEIQAGQVDLRQFEYSPLVDIQKWSGVPGDQPLFESLLVFENYPVNEAVRGQPASLALQPGPVFTRTNYPLTFAVSPGHDLGLEMAYDARRFSPDAIARLLGHFKTVLEALAANPDRPVSTISILTGAERRRALLEWNANPVQWPDGRFVHELFEAQADLTPDALAVIVASTLDGGNGDAAELEKQQLTYAGLDRKANQLAHRLQKLGVGPESLVAICVERSPEMLVALLAVLKAGGAYVPLDPNYPTGRLAFMLQDAAQSPGGLPVLLTQERLLDRLPDFGGQVVCLDRDWDGIAGESQARLLVDGTPDRLAYVIYTSGSTGAPKGVMVAQPALANHARSLAKVFDLGTPDRVLQLISLSFDASAEEIYPALISGAGLVLPGPAADLNGKEVLRLCEQEGVTVLHMPAAFWHQVVDEMVAHRIHAPASIRVLLAGGESPSVAKLRRWTERSPHPVRFLNAYGPTEATITTTFYETVLGAGGDAGISKLPVGRPIANVQVYLLDKNLQPVPIGVPGEIHIGGAGLARGYLNNPLLTTEKFIADPFNAQPGARLYRTGDMACYLPDGNIQFLGRLDDQVKLRGFRIELGEIEAAIRSHPRVQATAVLAREDKPGDKRIVAYLLTADSSESAQVSSLQQDLREFLKELLPAYMIPSAFVLLEGFPLLPNGKIDRRALARLAAPEKGQIVAGDEDYPTRTPVEEGLSELWCEVLGVDRVGLNDNFFELGGHSLLAMQLVSRIQGLFQVQVPLRELFEAPTLSGLAERVEMAMREASGLQIPQIEPSAGDHDPPLSFSQQRLWILDQLEPGNLFYNIPTAVRVKGKLDTQVLSQSLNEILRRHAVLRTCFQVKEGRPVQVILPELILETPVTDLRSLPEIERETEAKRLAAEEARRSFDLAHGPLIRSSLLQLGDQDYVVLLTMHHIIADGWSMGIFVRELASLYAYFGSEETAAGSPFPLPELKIQYADYARWQRDWLKGEILEGQLAYWKRQLDGIPPILELPTDHPRPAVQTPHGDAFHFTLPADLSAAVRSLGRDERATLFMTLLAAFQVLLSRYSGQEDLCVGTPIANRSRAETEELIGFFINTLVLRADLSGDPTFREVLERVREAALGAYAHQDLPFEALVEALQPKRNLSHTPLFQVMFVLNAPQAGSFQLPGLEFSAIQTHSGTATFDLTLSVTDSPDGFGGYIEYNTDLFERETIHYMIGHYRVLLEGITADPDQPISQLPLLTREEQRQLLVEWNETAMSTPIGGCVHELFEARAVKRPDVPAVIFEDQVLSYAGLDRRANQVANYLRKLGVGPDVLVGISTERSVEMITGILGILKAGGAYLPLDPTYPPDRLAFMLADSQVPILLTQARLLEALPVSDQQVLRLDADWPEIALESDEKPASEVKPENLAYVIYTSGSTGKPKGAMLRHSGLCNLTAVQRKAFGIKEGSRVLQFSPFSFDASVWETFMALANGGTLCLARQEVLASGPDLLRLLGDLEVTNVTLPPSVLRVLPDASLPALKTVIAAGEACTPDLIARWAPGRDFFNAYGPTETTVCASMYRCDMNDLSAPPIGRPIANTRLYILDQNMQPVPRGVPGELHVGGVSLARGYLNRPELTAEKFVRNPFITEQDARLYKTGDLVRYRADGNIEFLGRLDHQVKVRGFRIELGEVESALGGHPEIREAVALAREDVPGDSRLVAYLVLHGERVPTSGELRSFMRQSLPDYMLPSAFVFLDEFPLSPSGKVDRRALARLPAPDGQRACLEHEYIAPRTPDEEKLAAISAELLAIDQVGVYDNFFELGGHSLLATRFISRVREAYGVELPLRALFEHPNVAELAESLEKARQQGANAQTPAITPVSRDERRMKRSSIT